MNAPVPHQTLTTDEVVIASKIDRSVNIIRPRSIGFIEARYVRRTPEYMIAYVSSQTACNRGCKMCHLTTSGQMQYQDCDLDEYLDQIDAILNVYEDANDPCSIAHVNFMSRGDALANKYLLADGNAILGAMGERLLEAGLTPKFNMSTIIPKTLKQTLVQTFPLITPTIYYSIYSTDESWRKEWMPGAMNVGDALELLAEYQRVSKKFIKLHGAFIAGQNDDLGAVQQMMAEIDRRKLICEFNIVSYNPFSEEEGREADPERIEDICNVISRYMPVKVVSQVGRDCGASCGSFYPNHDLVAREQACAR